MSVPPKPVDQIQQLGEGMAARMPPRLAEIRSAWQAACAEDGWTPENTGYLYLVLHRLVGCSAQFGMTEIQSAAQAFEAEVVAHLGEALDDAKRRRMDALLEKLMQVAEEKIRLRLPDLQAHINATPSVRDSRATRLIYLVEDDPIQAEILSMQIGYFGYNVCTFTALEPLRRALEDVTPTAVVMDVILEEGFTAGPQAAAEIRRSRGDGIPLIFVSESDLFTHRLSAVRAGGEAYFLKPVDVSQLIDALDRLTAHEESPKYRILIVEDSSTQAKLFENYLQSAGMETRVVRNPLEVLPPLNEFNPDLVLLDMYMPQCSGMELASVIRQIDRFLSLPIVFLSAETDTDVQMGAMRLGGDDFLTKPITREHLVNAVASRAGRYRKLRDMMMRDGLTGLLNHTMLKDRLAAELLRAGRQTSPVAFAMLDLDRFKLVNDTYGHASGDQVLKGLARLLMQRMRASDSIGRYGGEEFAVILPDTPGEAAVRLMDELRDGFSKVVHHSGEGEFTVTFSCGVASFPRFVTPAEISDAADRALYAAKQRGRNRVVFADDLDEMKEG